MSEKLTKIMKNVSSGDWHSNMVNGTRFEITGGENSDKTIAFVFNEYDADFIIGCKTEVPKLLAEIERLRELAHSLCVELHRAGETIIHEFSGNIEEGLAKNEDYFEKVKKEIEGVIE